MDDLTANFGQDVIFLDTEVFVKVLFPWLNCKASFFSHYKLSKKASIKWCHQESVLWWVCLMVLFLENLESECLKSAPFKIIQTLVLGDFCQCNFSPFIIFHISLFSTFYYYFAEYLQDASFNYLTLLKMFITNWIINN